MGFTPAAVSTDRNEAQIFLGVSDTESPLISMGSVPQRLGFHCNISQTQNILHHFRSAYIRVREHTWAALVTELCGLEIFGTGKRRPKHHFD